MKNLFIIVGGAGVGKSAITNFVKSKNNSQYNVIKKHTTRPYRKEEERNDFIKDLDLYFETQEPTSTEDNIIDYYRGGGVSLLV